MVGWVGWVGREYVAISSSQPAGAGAEWRSEGTPPNSPTTMKTTIYGPHLRWVSKSGDQGWLVSQDTLKLVRLIKELVRVLGIFSPREEFTPCVL